MAVSLAFSPPASSATDNVDTLLSRALQQYEDGQFRPSLRTLQQAERIANAREKIAKIKLYQGLNRFVLEGPARAKRLFAEALRLEPRLALDPHRFKPSIVELLGRVRATVRGTIIVDSAPPGAIVLIDGKLLAGKKTPLSHSLPAGQHEIEARLAKQSFKETVVVRWGEDSRVDVRFAPATAETLPTAETPAAPETRPAVPGPSTPAPQPQKKRRLWTWIAGGTAVVAAGVGVGFSISAAIDFAEYESPDLTTERFDVLEERIPKKELIAGVFYAAAGAVAVTAAVLWWLEGRSSGSEQNQALLLPTFGPNQVGVSVSFSFSSPRRSCRWP